MNYGLKGLSILSVVMVFSGLILFSSEAAAESYSFAIGGFGNKVKFTNASGDSTVQVSQSIGDYLFDELQFCPSMELYDVTPLGSQARADEVSLQLDLGSVPPEYKDVQAEYLISGYLSNMGLTLSNCRFIAVGGFSYKITVDITLKVYEMDTGRCVYTAVGKGEANSADFDISVLGLHLMRFGDTEFSGECYDAALKKAVKQAAEKMKKDI